MKTEYKYKAFISYSHAADNKLAPALQRALQNFAKPWFQLRSIRVFRDETGLGVTPALWGSIEEALRESEYFLLLASPPAAQSEWVQKEVRWWLTQRSPDQLLMACTDGELVWNEQEGKFQCGSTSAVPLPLEKAFASVPHYSDLRFAKSSKDLSLRNPNFLAQVAKLSSTLRDRPLDELIGEDVAQHRRVRRLTEAAVTALTVLSIAAVIAALLARYQQKVANTQRTLAENKTVEARLQQHAAERQREISRQRLIDLEVSNGAREWKDGDWSAAMLWFGEALRQEQGNSGGERRQRLRMGATARAHPQLKQVWFLEKPPSESQSVDFSDDDRAVVSLDSGAIQIWDHDTGRALVPRLVRQGERICGLAYSNSRRQILSVGEDGRAHLWDIPSQKEAHSFQHDEGAVTSAAFSPNHETIVTGGEDNNVRLWDAATGRLRSVLSHTAPVDVSLFGQDDKHLLLLSGDHEIVVVDLQTKKRVALKNTTRSWPRLSPDAQRVLLVSTDAAASLWDARTGERVSDLGGWAWVDVAHFSPDGSKVLLASRTGWANIFDIQSDQELTSVRTGGSVIAAEFGPDGKQFATAGTDQKVRRWDVRTGKPIGPPLAHEDTVAKVAYNRAGTRLVSTTAQGVIRVWDLVASQPQETVVLKGIVNIASLNKAGDYLLTATDSSAHLTAIRTHTTVDLNTPTQLYCAAFSPDGRLALTGNEDGKARVWDVASGQLRKKFTHKRRVNRALLTPDGKCLVTASELTVSVFDLAKGHLLREMQHDAPVLHLDISQDNTRVLAVDFEAESRVWELATGRELEVLRRKGVKFAAFIPDGSRIAACSESDGTIEVYDTATGATIAHTPAVDYESRELCFSPGGGQIASAYGSEARIWNAATGQPLTPPLLHNNVITQVRFSPDGASVLTAGTDGASRLWDTANGLPLTPPLSHSETVRDAEFDANGNLIATACEDGRARVWDLSVPAESVQELTRTARLLAARRIDATGAIVSLTVKELQALWKENAGSGAATETSEP